ncbi:beta-N-acetylhexosaminidase [Paenibacillus camerounensis]|uniref:beta-N-acetylhexosaminidase n=1 Tax=Paenibacillus camerounensis TaxID=1243663 RepID=UPI000A324C24|nr:glycoside hydrolase family 20 protein [Paenibacillus camerounensis]
MDEQIQQERRTPYVQHYTVASGEQWRLSAQSRILLINSIRSNGNELLPDTVNLILEEMAASGLLPGQLLPVLHGETEAALPGDMVIERSDQAEFGGSIHREGYCIDIGSTVTITAASERAVMYALRTVMQQCLNNGFMQYGRIIDYPVMPERALHIDIGRKYYSAEWIKERIGEMSRLRLNTLQLHFSENEGFRLMSEKYPEVMSEQYLTKEQVRDIIATAARYHIDVIPSLDSPGHLGYALRNHPEWLLKDSSGAAAPGALDITNTAARRFVLELIDEYAELFAGSTHFHIGGDEFIDFGQFGKYPQLAEYARSALGISGGTGVDTYIDYLNGIADHLEAKGWTVRAWNDGLYRGDLIQKVQPKPSIQITYWTKWHEQMAPVETFIANGHQVLNYNDAYFYYVLGEHAGYTYPIGKKISSSWHPGLFPGKVRDAVQEYSRPYPPWLIGCSFSVWSDRPEAQTAEEVGIGISEPLQAMAQKAWMG